MSWIPGPSGIFRDEWVKVCWTTFDAWWYYLVDDDLSECSDRILHRCRMWASGPCCIRHYKAVREGLSPHRLHYGCFGCDFVDMACSWQDKYTAEEMLKLPEESFFRVLTKASSKGRVRGISEGIINWVYYGNIIQFACVVFNKIRLNPPK